MTEHFQKKIFTAFEASLLSLFLSLIPISSGWTQINIDGTSNIQRLKNPDPKVRSRAADALAELGPEAKDAVPLLIKALQDDKNIGLRVAVAKALWRVGSEAKDAVPALADALRDDNIGLRVTVANALGGIGPEAKDAVPALTDALRDKNIGLRVAAAKALWRVGSEAKDAVPALADALRDDNIGLRVTVANALGSIGPEAKDAVPALADALRDKNIGLRVTATSALGSIGPGAREAVPDLRIALRGQNVGLRVAAANALGGIGSGAKDAVPDLENALRGQNVGLRVTAANALGGIGSGAKDAVPDLQKALKDGNTGIRITAINALGGIGSGAKDAVPDLQKALKDGNTGIRITAINALGGIGSGAKDAIADLIETLKNDGNIGIRITSANALGSIAEGFQDDLNQVSDSDLDDVTSKLKVALSILEDRQDEISEARQARVRRSLNALVTERDSRLYRKTLSWIQKSPWLIGIGIVAALYLGLLWLRPKWLLLLPAEFTIPNTAIKLSPQLILFFKYHPRVLDAWVTQQIESARKGFEKKRTVVAREVYIPVPVILDRETVPHLTSRELASKFSGNRSCLLIWGEGGAGKTSLVCQIAKWAMSKDPSERFSEHLMLPVLIEQELNFKLEDGKQAFKEAIRGQLQALIGEAEKIEDGLFVRLLRHRRILVIVDHLSEMNEATRNEIRPGHPDFPANALIVTSRIEEELDEVPKTVIKPLRVEGNRLSSFMEAYLVQRGKRELFTDQEYFDACSKLSQMVDQRNITALLAKLYAEQMISKKKEIVTDNALPDTIPDLMLNYLNELNRVVANDGEMDDRTLFRDSKIIAWKCLERSYRSGTANREVILSAIGGDDHESASII
jgi:HEAT repeat protein